MSGLPVEVWTIDNEQAGQRVDAFIASRLQVSRARAQKLVSGAEVNGAPVKASYTLRAGDAITIVAPVTEPAVREDAAGTGVEKSAIPQLPPILFEDEHILVLNKPRGLVVHPGAGEPKTTLVEVLQVHGRQLSSIGAPERAGIVHRLDQETSGLMVVCKSDEAHEKLAEDFAARRVEKRYTAIVCGVPRSRGRIEAPIARHPVQRKKMAVAAEGRLAITEYQVVKTWAKYALLEIDLLTGRTHQIRVHLSYVHYPVVGDDVYSGRKRSLDSAPTPEVREAIAALPGQALHAAKLSFEHPVTGERLNFYSPCPPEMQRIIDALDATSPEVR